MPESNQDKSGMLEKGVGHFQQNFPIQMSNNLIKVVSNNVLSGSSPISYAAFKVISTIAEVGANCFAQSGAKRKAESGNAEYSVGGGEGDFGCVHKLDEITNKRPRVVDNFVPREKEEQNLDELFNIPKPVTSFVERGEIEELCENFEKNCSMQVLTSQVSIVGLGGIGKTQLAAKFVEKNKDKYECNFWIDAERYCIAGSFKQLAKEIEVSLSIEGEGEKSKSRLVKDVYEKLRNQRTLIVFDNVDDYNSVKEFLPHQDDEKINVLITSRYNKWKNTGVRPVELGVFTPKESIGLIKKELKIDNDKEAEKLHNKLQGLPLALQQAVAYIKQQRILNSNFGIQDYLKEYGESYKKAEELLSCNLHENNNDPYMKTVMTTWQVTLDKIKKDTKCGNEAIRILNVMSYLAPDNIKNSMFLNLYELRITPSEFKKQKKEIRNKVANAIDLLKSYSMINQGNTLDLSNIHRLVQEVIRIDLKNEKKEKDFLSDAAYCLEHGDSDNLGSFMFLIMYVSQYKNLNSSVCALLEGCGQSFMNEDIWNFQENYSMKHEEERFFAVARVILKNYIKSDNYKMIKFLVENVQSYYLSRGQSKEWKAMLLDSMGSYYGNKKEMIRYLSKLGLELKFDCFNCVKDFPYEFLYSSDLKDFFVKQEILNVYERQDRLEFLKKIKLTVEICQALEIWCEKKIQELPISNKIFAEGMTQRKWYIKYKYEPLQKRAKELISLIEKKQSTLRDSGQDETLNSDSESFELLDFDEEEPPILDYYGPSTEALENDLNDAIEGSPRSTVHSPSVTRSDLVCSTRY